MSLFPHIILIIPLVISLIWLYFCYLFFIRQQYFLLKIKSPLLLISLEKCCLLHLGLGLDLGFLWSVSKANMPHALWIELWWVIHLPTVVHALIFRLGSLNTLQFLKTSSGLIFFKRPFWWAYHACERLHVL